MAIVAFIVGGLTGTLAFSVSWLVLGTGIWMAAKIYFSVGLTTAGLMFVWCLLPREKKRYPVSNHVTKTVQVENSNERPRK